MLKRGRPYQRIQAVMIGRDTHTREEIIAFTTRDVLLVPRRKPHLFLSRMKLGLSFHNLQQSMHARLTVSERVDE
jgi:hypothetical protein